jgi:hypothetical protein
LAVKWYILAAASHRCDVISAGIGHPLLATRLHGSTDEAHEGFLKRRKWEQITIWVTLFKDTSSVQFTLLRTSNVTFVTPVKWTVISVWIKECKQITVLLVWIRKTN